MRLLVKIFEKSGKSLKCICIFLTVIYINVSCREDIKTPPSIYTFVEPKYDNIITLKALNDTLRFPLDEKTFNDIRSFNLFENMGREYISFYDRRSESINIYDFHSQHLTKKIKLKKSLKRPHLYRISVYTKKFDSIFVTDRNSLYLLNSEGVVKKQISYLSKPASALPKFENINQPVLKGTTLYTIVRPFVQTTSLSALKEWKVLYGFNLLNNEVTLYYHLPDFYQKSFYGYNFLTYNFCYNDRGNFVFSFPADTLIYETNLIDYHRSYYAKSRYQTSSIQPLSKESLLKREGLKEYAIRDSYGAIYFDPFKKRYLRFSKQKMTENDFLLKIRRKSQSLIIFNENLKIISESEIKNEFSFNSIFFSRNGNMYSRIEANNENTLLFIRLTYEEAVTQPTQLAQSSPKH